MFANNYGMGFIGDFIIYKIMVGRNESYMRTNVGIITNFDAVKSINIYTRRITWENMDAPFYIVGSMEGTGMVYRPLCVAILSKYFSENKLAPYKYRETGYQNDYGIEIYGPEKILYYMTFKKGDL
jgi:hypothetical protein